MCSCKRGQLFMPLSELLKRRVCYFNLLTLFTRTEQVLMSPRHTSLFCVTAKDMHSCFLQPHCNDCSSDVSAKKVALLSPLCLDAFQAFIMVSLFVTHARGKLDSGLSKDERDIGGYLTITSDAFRHPSPGHAI
jgi:hypothetical protein